MPTTAQSDGGDRTCDSLAEAWRTFFTTHRDAHVPAPNDGLERVSKPGAFRVRVSGAKRFAFGEECARIAARGNALGARVTCSFYDESTGRFFGTTTSGATLPIELPASLNSRDATEGDGDSGDGAGAADPMASATWTARSTRFSLTEIRDKRRLAVFEIVLVETHPSTSLVLRETSGGWAATPLDEGEDGGQPETEDGGATAKEKAVPVRRGSPRYLAWGAPRTGKYPPDSMGECALSVTVETLSSSFVEIMSRFVRKDALALADAAVPGVDGTLAGFSSTAPVRASRPRPVPGSRAPRPAQRDGARVGGAARCGLAVHTAATSQTKGRRANGFRLAGDAVDALLTGRRYGVILRRTPWCWTSPSTRCARSWWSSCTKRLTSG